MCEGSKHVTLLIGQNCAKRDIDSVAPQVFNNSGDDHSYLEYDADECESSLNALFHDMSEVETKGCWLRMWCETYFILRHICDLRRAL